jgi:two-component system, OmpR family, alkaline phosphatase synthesis response regulator PhoP
MKRVKVLIADDNQNLLSALHIQLRAYGFEVVTCTNADLAIAHAQKEMPDVIVLDVRMDGDHHNILSSKGDGFGVLERMKKLPELRAIPVIYITGDPSSQLDLRAEQLGAFGLIHKPASLSKLTTMIDSAIKSRFENDDQTFQTAPQPHASEMVGGK